MTTEVKVAQIDRDAAARWCDYGPDTNDRIRAGQLDHAPGVQAFARHRLADRAAIVAWLRGEFQQEHWTRFRIADAIEQGQHHDD